MDEPSFLIPTVSQKIYCATLWITLVPYSPPLNGFDRKPYLFSFL
jgi:hypothetical protein